MYEIAIEDSFDAAHCLRNYQGNCQRLHGHTYKVVVRFHAGSLDDMGMAIDFRKAKSMLKSIIDYMDHRYINELPEFSIQNPTAENIAKFFFDRIASESEMVHSVSVWETPTSCATYVREE
ncbi:MAG: 6-carboxytetrahydropterin synthase QueD [Armatimonadota bacterium]|nr:6-carboxytetrahydropterin synthase QueD [bacterium]